MTTASDIVDYYVNTIILQYLGKVRARATIGAVVDPIIMPTAGGDLLPILVQDAFAVTTAVGVQLNVIGRYTGAVRTGTVGSSQVTLNDADYRTLIQMAIVKNSSGSSLAEIVGLLFQFFPLSIVTYDHKLMRMSYLISTVIGSQELIQLFVNEGILPVPMAVGVAVIYYPVLDQFFGFRTYTLAAFNSNPFNNYASYQTTWPWLSYAYSIHP